MLHKDGPPYLPRPRTPHGKVTVLPDGTIIVDQAHANYIAAANSDSLGANSETAQVDYNATDGDYNDGDYSDPDDDDFDFDNAA